MSTTTTQALEGNNKVRVGNIRRRLDDNDIRFGSYLVHTPPSTPSGGDGGGRAGAVAGKSNIPGYQFKSKIATINLQPQRQSPPLSPKKSCLTDQLWAPDGRNGNAHSDNSDMRRQHYQSQQSSLNCSPNHQAKSSLANAASPPSSRLTPKAIPRSMLNLKQQSNLTSRTSHLQEFEPNNMGDRLSSPAIQHLSFNSNSSLAQAPTTKSHHSIDADHWNGQLSPVLSRYQFSEKNLVSARQGDNGDGFGDEIHKVTPRLPRGVSKIPHQVQSHANVNHYQSHESSIENCASRNRYLTFSKDQATSHCKSLREELCGQKREINKENQEPDKAAANENSASLVKPKPLERLSKTFGTDVNVVEHAKFLTTPNPPRQQPICEAFIMTGQSMLKLSCNESENNNNHDNTNSHKQTEAKQKSLSLNKLNSANQVNNKPHSEGMSRHKPTQELTTTEVFKQQPGGSERNKPTAISTTLATAATLSEVRTELSTANTFASMKAGPDLDNRSGITASSKDNTSSYSVGLFHQTATNIHPSTPTEITKIKETQVIPMSIELSPGFWNKANKTPDPGTASSKVSQERADSKGHSIWASGKQDSWAENNSIVQKSPPQAGDWTQDDKRESSIAKETMKKCEEQKSGVVNPYEIDSHILETSMSALSSTNSNCNDRDSARRLAKRLYNLSGFKRSDVCHHLAKSNPFSQMVAEEYVNLFDFRSMKLDSALRKFLSKLQLNGETQERERMLSQFSQRYYDCNKDKFPNADAVQTLVCALILLNTDLHGGHSKKKRSKLSLGAFIDGLNNSIAGALDCGDNSSVGGIQPAIGGVSTIAYTFPRHLLIDLYESIKKRPLKCSDDKCDMTSLEAELDKIYSQQAGSNRSNTLPTRRFVPGSNAPSSTLNASSRRHFKQGLSKLNSGSLHDDADSAIQFKSGYLNRKRVFGAHGKRISKGRRSWRRVFVTLQDLRMIMQLGICDDPKDEDDKQTAKKISRAQTIAQKMKNTVKIHHAFAKRSTSYTKRDNVFHLKLADQSEVLLQANTDQEMSSWVDTINFAASCLSSPALPSAISSTKQPQNQRPLLPAAYTKLSYWEQLIDHEERLQKLKVDLDEHLSEAPNTKNAKKKFKTEFIDKIAFLKHEIERYTVYVDLMRKKSNSPEAIILSKHPHIASLTPSDEMILSLPSFAPPQVLAATKSMSNQKELATD